jgi:hypothetical protein
VVALPILVFLGSVSCFHSHSQRSVSVIGYNTASKLRVSLEPKNGPNFEKVSSDFSKGFVSTLSRAVNSLAWGFRSGSPSKLRNDINRQSPRSPEELLERICRDYTDNNYLWTGDIDLTAFAMDCRFSDPTISFTGTDQFVHNIQNLRPIVDALVRPGGCRSDLLDIQLCDEDKCIQTRWNMVGELSRLPWKPKIDVIGRTKFWYASSHGSCRVIFYDEEWEIPAAKALLQLVTPGGTINSN